MIKIIETRRINKKIMFFENVLKHYTLSDA